MNIVTLRNPTSKRVVGMQLITDDFAEEVFINILMSLFTTPDEERQLIVRVGDRLRVLCYLATGATTMSTLVLPDVLTKEEWDDDDWFRRRISELESPPDPQGVSDD